MKYLIKRHKVIQPIDQSIKLIPLTQGKNTIVDASDYEFLMQWNWFALKTPRGFCAARGEGGHMIYMHRVLTNNKGRETDHCDHDTLNNRRLNLRPCNQSQNQGNRNKQHTNSTSIYKGVHKTGKRWVAKIRVCGNQIYLGRFKTPKEAADAYDKAAKKHFGEFARQNFNQ